MKTTVTASNFTKPEDFRVYGLEKIQPAYSTFEGKMYAGMLPSDNGSRTGMTMFWMFQPDQPVVPDSLVLWLNGGPGCSSFNCGVMMEHSPVTQPLHAAGYCCLQPTPELHANPHAWTRATTMLYVEHPIGTGFSYGHPLPKTEEEASTDLDAFLQNFMQVFTEFQTAEFFVTGESYAGMFVPAVSRAIHRANKKGLTYSDNTKRIPILLKGAALGNGWIDPKIQGPATIDYSWWHGLIDKPTRDALHHEWNNCMKHDKQGSGLEPPPFHPFNVQDDCGIMWGILQAAGNPNAYDITTWDPNVDQITFTSEAFYNDPRVKEALHVLNTDHYWHGCQAGSGRRRRLHDQQGTNNHYHHHRKLYMDNDRPLSVVPYIGELLDEGIPMIVYNGDRDMTTNMVGSELALNGMEWSGQEGWLNAPRGLWKVEDYPAGWTKTYKNLTFAVVYNSGHMVPYNQPTVAYDLLMRLLTHKSFLDTETAQIRIQEDDTARPPFDQHGYPQDTHVSGSKHSVASSMRHSHTGLIMPVGLALLAGFALGALFFRKRSKSQGGGYHQVPDVDSAQDD